MRGYDPDGDDLQFGVTGSDSSLVTVVSRDAYTGDLYLTRELDHETQAELTILLTLTDGKLGENNFITQPVLILVEDSNDNSPLFVKIPAGPVSVLEHSLPEDRVIATFLAEDRDSGAFGQVVYGLAAGQTDEVYQHFAVKTGREGGELHLQAELDYEASRLFQVVVEARDRASLGQANTAQATIIVEVRDYFYNTGAHQTSPCRWRTFLTDPQSGSQSPPSPEYRRTFLSSLRWVVLAPAPAPVNCIISM